MSEPEAEPSIPLFDVTVQIPANSRLEDIDRKAREAGIPDDRVDALMKVLRSVPEARIGSKVPRERADRAREQFKAAGLNVIITPVLSLQAKTEVVGDGMITCPSCNTRVALPENRQCPNCGVFVDKVTEEALMRRRLLEQERKRVGMAQDREARDAEKKMRETLEAALREQIREEVEAEFGIKRERRGWGGKWVRGAALVGLVGVSFAGGMVLKGGGEMPWKGGSTAAKAGPDLDALVAGQGPKGQDTAAVTAAAAAANGGAPTGDADVDDPLIQAAGGNRIGAKGISVEEAVAAAQVLAKSVGHGGGAGGAAGAGGGAPDAASPGGQAAGDPNAAKGAAPLPLGGGDKAALTAEFASQLAELGQLGRARTLLGALKDKPEAREPGAAAALRLAAMEVNAWAVQGLPADAARKAVEALVPLAASLPTPAERAAALARTAVIVAQQPQLQPDVARGLLTRAADATKAIDDEATRVAASNEWIVALAQVMAAEADMRARTGQLGRAKALAAQVGPLVQKATDPLVQARLHAVEAQAWHDAGERDKAGQSIEAALALLAGEGSLPRRAAALREVSQLAGDAGQDKLVTAAAAIQALAEDKTGSERLASFSQLALLHAAAGAPARAEPLKRKALTATGVAPDEAGPALARLLVRSDLAAARRAHGYGQYAESETFLRRVADYLL